MVLVPLRRLDAAPGRRPRHWCGPRRLDVAAALLARRGYPSARARAAALPALLDRREPARRAPPSCCTRRACSTRSWRCGFQYKNGAAFVRDDLYSEFNFADKFSRGLSVHVPGAARAVRPGARQGGGAARRDDPLRGRDHRDRRFRRAPVVTGARPAMKSTTHRPRFVLDASGFGRTLPRLLDLDRPSDFPERAALFVHVKDNIVSGEFDRQKIRIGVHPTKRDVWSWLIPFSNGNASLGVVASREHHARFTRHAPKNGCGS